jgi:dinuclear metal center YbgI/SA1388 family protein
MIRVKDISKVLEERAPTGLQESWDNSGLVTGHPEQEVTGVLICLDVTLPVIDEALKLGYNLIVSHHPAVFSGLKKFTGNSLSERVVVAAIRHGIALYGCHTNLDSVHDGVSGLLASRLGLIRTSILVPRENDLIKIVCFVPASHRDAVSSALFSAGAGTLGNYDECSFQTSGTGTFRPGEGTNPFTGKKGERANEAEVRIETIVPIHLAKAAVRAMIDAHPYEEVAYDLYPLKNSNPSSGLGILGELKEVLPVTDFLDLIKRTLNLSVVKHSVYKKGKIKRVAVCGGSGAEFLPYAVKSGCDAYLTGDIKYHQWFEVPEGMLLADIGHYESEQFAMNGLYDFLIEKFPTFAVRLTEVNTNPINYY